MKRVGDGVKWAVPLMSPRICSVICRIPPGRVATYGQVAREAGLGRRARFVGQVLARLPEGSDVPWHRVLRADGRLAFEPGTELHRRQRSLLEQEGILFSGPRVDLRRHRWQASLDELLWGGESS
jgi:methylated-DNA-protein-cysteine methyltransferase related protein